MNGIIGKEAKMCRCKYYFGRTVKDEQGIVVDYEYGCFMNHDATNCINCKYKEEGEDD